MKLKSKVKKVNSIAPAILVIVAKETRLLSLRCF